MRHRTPFRLSAAAAATGAALVASTAVSAAQQPPTLADAVAEEASLAEQLETALTDVEDLEQRVALTRDRIDRLDEDVRHARRAASEAEARVQDRIRALFKSPTPAPILQAVTGTVGETADRLATITLLNGREDVVVAEAEAAELQAMQTEALLAAEQQRLRDQLDDLEARSAELQDDLERASQLVEDLRGRAARQRQIDRGRQQGTYSCIFEPDATTFIDSWGFPRSGGRRHQGTDVMAARDEPVYAITSGTIDRLKTGGLGGIVAYLEGDDGVRYYYAHLEGYVDGLAVGQRVEAGELIAFNGDSGNARGGPTHVHFQVDPGSGPVNPYPWLMAACR